MLHIQGTLRQHDVEVFWNEGRLTGSDMIVTRILQRVDKHDLVNLAATGPAVPARLDDEDTVRHLITDELDTWTVLASTPPRELPFDAAVQY